MTDEELIYYQATNEVVVSTSRIDELGEKIDLAVKTEAIAEKSGEKVSGL